MRNPSASRYTVKFSPWARLSSPTASVASTSSGSGVGSWRVVVRRSLQPLDLLLVEGRRGLQVEAAVVEHVLPGRPGACSVRLGVDVRLRPSAAQPLEEVHDDVDERVAQADEGDDRVEGQRRVDARRRRRDPSARGGGRARASTPRRPPARTAGR